MKAVLKTIATIIIRLLSWIPTLGMMYIIFSFSAQAGDTSGALSLKVAEKLIGHFSQGLSPDQVHTFALSLQYPIRKLAHFSEYAVLALCMAITLACHGVRGFKLFVCIVLFAAAFAAGDEYHQSFVPGRGPSVVDVLIDSSGAICMAVLLGIITRRRRARMKV